MRIRARFLGLGAVLTLGATVLVLLVAFASAASGQAKHASWDIVGLTFPGGVTTINAGGFAEAKTPEGATIRLTGSGTFVSPAGNNRGSGAVTGGGTWQTFTAAGAPTSTIETYTVEELVSFEFANFQLPVLGDTIGDPDEKANGTAVFRIAYSDGTQGVLTVGCHGPGAPAGIFEGIAATKSFTTYYAVQPPGANPNFNRTIFHVAG